jgi:hypothetical protein
MDVPVRKCCGHAHNVDDSQVYALLMAIEIIEPIQRIKGGTSGKYTAATTSQSVSVETENSLSKTFVVVSCRPKEK